MQHRVASVTYKEDEPRRIPQRCEHPKAFGHMRVADDVVAALAISLGDRKTDGARCVRDNNGFVPSVHWLSLKHWFRTKGIRQNASLSQIDLTRPFGADVPVATVRGRLQTSLAMPRAQLSGTLHMRSLRGADHLEDGDGELPKSP